MVKSIAWKAVERKITAHLKRPGALEIGFCNVQPRQGRRGPLYPLIARSPFLKVRPVAHWRWPQMRESAKRLHVTPTNAKSHKKIPRTTGD